MLAAMNVSAQTAEFTSAELVLFTEANGLHISEFKVDTDIETVKGYIEKLKPYEAEIRGDYQTLAGGIIRFRLAFIPDVDVNYVVKILTFLEIENVILEGKQLTLSELPKQIEK